MFGLGMGELVVVFFVVLLLFGAKNLPEIAKGLGKAVRDFRRAANEVRQGIEVDISSEPVNEAEGNLKKISIDTEAKALPPQEEKAV